MKRTATIATLILLIASIFATAVSAQDNSGNPPPQQGLGEIQPIRGLFAEMMRVATDTTGLTVEEIAQQIRDGSTLGDIITNNGGDIETVISTVMETVSNRLQQQVDAGNITQDLSTQLQATAEQFLRDWMNNAAPIPHLAANHPILNRIETGLFAEFVRVVTDTTGLTVNEIVQQMQDGTSLAEIITNNGGNVDTVTQTVLDSLSSRLQGQVDAGNITADQMTNLMDAAKQRLTDWMNGDVPFPRLNRPNNQPIRNQIVRGVVGELVRAVTDATGLSGQEIAQQMRDGSTLGEIITNNGGNVDTITQTVLDSLNTRLQAQVDAGNLTTDQMNTISDSVNQRLTDWLNGDTPLPRLNQNR